MHGGPARPKIPHVSQGASRSRDPTGTPTNEIQNPMAEVILGSLLSSTFLNLVVVPVLFLRFGDAR